MSRSIFSPLVFVGCVIAGSFACDSSEAPFTSSSDAGAGAIDPGVRDDDDGGGPADSGGTDARDASAEAGPQVTLSDATPADGALHVSLLSTVTLRYSAPLSAASVNATHVRLLAPNATVGLPARVAYDDATCTITVTPSSALSSDSVYRIATTGLTAADGSPVADTTLSFTTLFNAGVDAISYDATGATITGLTKYTTDAIGRLSRSATMATGPDGMFQTPDDVPTDGMSWSYGQGTSRLVFHTGPGADGYWFTADDVVAFRIDFDRSVAGRTRNVRYGAPGPDGKWLTADDEIAAFDETRWNADGREDRWTAFMGIGVDGTPFTADDLVSARAADTWTSSSGRRVTFTGPGVDGTWGTSDDYVSSVTVDDLDRLGRVTARRALEKGPDGLWLTADDVTTGIEQYLYDPKGLLSSVVVHTGAGSDGVWMTSDDVLGRRRVYTTAANGALEMRRDYLAGPDGVHGTADDVVVYVIHYDGTR